MLDLFLNTCTDLTIINAQAMQEITTDSYLDSTSFRHHHVSGGIINRFTAKSTKRKNLFKGVCGCFNTLFAEARRCIKLFHTMAPSILKLRSERATKYGSHLGHLIRPGAKDMSQGT